MVRRSSSVHVMVRVATALVASVLVGAFLLVGTASSQSTTSGQAGTVTLEWLGWSHYRFTSPNGKVVLTNPFVNNPDSPVKLEDISQADIILPADGHGDDQGAPSTLPNKPVGPS